MKENVILIEEGHSKKWFDCELLKMDGHLNAKELLSDDEHFR